MTIVKIAFDPAGLKGTDEAWPAFQAGGLTLKLWALWKRHHITNQHFRDVLESFAEYIEKAFDAEDESESPYQDIDQFIIVLRRCGLDSFSGIPSDNLQTWVVRYWDHFNLSIQREIALEYQATEPVTKRVTVGGTSPTPPQENDR